MSIKETVDSVLITIFVKPNSPKFAIEYDKNNGSILVYATEEPDKGKVNKEIIKELAKIFRANVTLVSGVTSRQKQLSVEVKREKLEQVLREKQK